MIRLTCPLCGTTIADGREPEVGERCPGCDAVLLDWGSDPVSACAAALEQRGIDINPAELAEALFALPADDPRTSFVGITSDEREGFYRWWVLLRTDHEDVLHDLIDGDPANA